MQPLPIRQLRTHLAQAADACACALANDEEPFFKRLEWWLADGAFNHEPFGMFRTDDPYRADDTRTVAQFLDQETGHRWDGMHRLRDLFCQQVCDMLEAWCRRWLASHTPVGEIPDEEWEARWSQEWDESLFMVNLNPRVHASAWEEFLGLPMATLVERWRDHAGRVAAARALRAARLVSRQGVEAAVIDRVADELAFLRRQHPDAPIAAHFDRMAQPASGISPLELAIYAHSSAFSRRLDATQAQAIQQRHPLPPQWLEIQAPAEPEGQGC